MSSVFKSPKVVVQQPAEVVPDAVDDNEIVYELEKKRKKKMGAVSQLLAREKDLLDNSNYFGKKTLGE